MVGFGPDATGDAHMFFFLEIRSLGVEQWAILCGMC